MLDEDTTVAVNDETAQIKDLTSLTSFTTRIFEASLASDEIVLSSNLVSHMVIRLPAKGYSALDFDMGEYEKKLLVEAAEKTIKKHYAQGKGNLI